MSLRALAPDDYDRLVPALEALEMNTLFAGAVLARRAPGRVLVDSDVAYVIHAYGMSLLFGPCDAAVAAEVVARRRTADEWLQVAPAAWAEAIAGGPRVESHTRVNFQFSPEAYRVRRLAFPEHRARRADRADFERAGSVVPRAFWRTADELAARGAAFAVDVDGELAAMAFSAFVTDTQLEIGIETAPRHRGRGLATVACAALIDHCLARGLEPVWACRLENTASHRLAEALGFEPARHLPYFRLAASG